MSVIHMLALELAPLSWENGDTPKNGDPHPHFTGNMGMGIPIFPVKWGPGSPFYREYGDPLVKIGIPWDPRFHGKMEMGSPFYRENRDLW